MSVKDTTESYYQYVKTNSNTYLPQQNYTEVDGKHQQLHYPTNIRNIQQIRNCYNVCGRNSMFSFFGSHIVNYPDESQSFWDN